MPDREELVEALLKDFPALRYGYASSDDLRHLMARLAAMVNELAANEPDGAGLRRTFAWAACLASSNATAACAPAFQANLSSLARAFEVRS